MIKSYKSSLQLNSYKIDTNSYEQKLHLLTRENEELKTAIYQYKTKQNRMIDQLRSTKQENNSLRIKIRTETGQIEASCRNCSRLENQLKEIQVKTNAQCQQQNQKAKQYKEMYENELQNKKAAAQYYQKKMHSLLRDKDVLIKKYQDKIRLIHTQYSQTNLKSQPHLDSTTSIDRFFSPKKQAQIPEQNSQLANIQKSARKFPPSPPKVKQIKPVRQSQKVVVVKKKASEQQLDNLLIPFMQRLQKMNLTLKQLRYIQQIDRFSSAGLIAKNRYIKLMKEFPFQCDDQQMIELSYEYIVTTLRINRKEETGANIIEFLMNRLSQLQQQKEQ